MGEVGLCERLHYAYRQECLALFNAEGCHMGMKTDGGITGVNCGNIIQKSLINNGFGVRCEFWGLESRGKDEEKKEKNRREDGFLD